MEFCTYITIYSGKVLPPFYIGSSSIARVNAGYRGSVKSRKYVEIWQTELENNPHLFKTLILSKHSTREQAYAREDFIQRQLKVNTNPLYVNQHLNGRFYPTAPARPKGSKLSDAHRNAISKACVGRVQSEETKRKISESKRLYDTSVKARGMDSTFDSLFTFEK